MNPPTVTLQRASQLLGVARSTAYQAVADGTFPAPVLRVGSRILVPTAPLLEALGIDELPQPQEAA